MQPGDYKGYVWVNSGSWVINQGGVGGADNEGSVLFGCVCVSVCQCVCVFVPPPGYMSIDLSPAALSLALDTSE